MYKRIVFNISLNEKKLKDPCNTVHQHINSSAPQAHATSYVNAIVRLDPKGRLQGNEQHVVHFNFIEQLPLKINRHKKKYHFVPSAI